MKHIKKITLIALAVFLLGTFSAQAGNLYPSNAPSETMYSLQEIYNLITTSATSTPASGTITNPGSVSSSMVTLESLYNAVYDLLDLDAAVATDEDPITVEFVSESTELVGSDESKGLFTLVFKVIAPSDDDIYINDAATSIAALNTAGVEYSFVSGSVATKTSETLSLVSGGSQTGGLLKVTKGNQATFRMQIGLDNNGGLSNQSVRLGLDALNYATNTLGTSTSTYASFNEDFRTGPETLYNRNLSD